MVCARIVAKRSELLEGKSQPGIDGTPERRIPILPHNIHPSDFLFFQTI